MVLESALNIDAGLRITAERARADRFGPAEGLFLGNRTRSVLSDQFDEKHLWSPSQLEAYAYCPFRFLMERILQLEPLDDLALETDYLRRGAMVHELLAEFHAQLKEKADSVPPTSKYDDRNFQERFRAILDAIVKATPLWGVDAALRELDRRQALDWAADYYRQHSEYDQQFSDLDAPLLPAHFEVRFGPTKHTDDGPEGDLSTDAPFELDPGDTVIRITGRVDRIDLGCAAGQTVFNVIDYKTGAARAVTDEDIERGLRLQSPLYAMAVEQLLLKQDNAIAWQADYWWFRKEGFGKKIGRSKGSPKAFQLHTIQDGILVPTERWERLHVRVVERVKQIVAGIRRGEFPMASKDDDCTRNCPFRTVCRISHVRALEKPWPPVDGAL